MTEPYPTSFLLYGDAGSHKSEFAATCPKPELVLCFDPPSKARPYLRAGTPEEPKRKGEIVVQEVMGRKTGKPIITIEYYNDTIAAKPNAFRIFRERMVTLERELDRYRTLVLDSTTFMRIAAFNDMRYRRQPGMQDNRKFKDPRKWYALVAEQLNEMLMVRVANMDITVVVIAHVKEEKDEVHGNLLYSIAAPGQLAKLLPGGFAETYRAYVNKRGEPLLQTELNRHYVACTQIPAPNPCAPNYKAVWENDNG